MLVCGRHTRRGIGRDVKGWPRTDAKQWFPCKVKSLNDHLGSAQMAWIKDSWDQIGGRFLLLLFGLIESKEPTYSTRLYPAHA
jgi:hypothetical protein